MQLQYGKNMEKFKKSGGVGFGETNGEENFTPVVPLELFEMGGLKKKEQN